MKKAAMKVFVVTVSLVSVTFLLNACAVRAAREVVQHVEKSEASSNNASGQSQQVQTEQKAS